MVHPSLNLSHIDADILIRVQLMKMLFKMTFRLTLSMTLRMTFRMTLRMTFKTWDVRGYLRRTLIGTSRSLQEVV